MSVVRLRTADGLAQAEPVAPGSRSDSVRDRRNDCYLLDARSRHRPEETSDDLPKRRPAGWDLPRLHPRDFSGKSLQNPCARRGLERGAHCTSFKTGARFACDIRPSILQMEWRVHSRNALEPPAGQSGDDDDVVAALKEPIG